jgi:hypothetical protein
MERMERSGVEKNRTEQNRKEQNIHPTDPSH